MKKKRRMEITFEKRELIVVRRGGGSRTTFCQSCGFETAHSSVFYAAVRLQISETAVFRLIESGQIHTAENAAGGLVVCRQSLADLAETIGR